MSGRPERRVSDRTVVRAVRPHVHFIKSDPIDASQARSSMANKKTDSSASLRSDDPANPSKRGLSAKPKAASLPAGAEPRLDTRFHRTFKVSVAAREKRAVIVEVSVANEAGNCLLGEGAGHPETATACTRPPSFKVGGRPLKLDWLLRILPSVVLVYSLPSANLFGRIL